MESSKRIHDYENYFKCNFNLHDSVHIKENIVISKTNLEDFYKNINQPKQNINKPKKKNEGQKAERYTAVVW